MTTNETQPSPSTVEKDRPLFDVAVCDKLRAAFVDIFLQFPEVSCLATSISWKGNLNDASIMHGIWLNSDGGPVTEPAGVVGSTFQTLKMLDEQLGRGLELVKYLRDQVTVLSSEVLKKHEELKNIEALKAAAKNTKG